MAATEIAEKLRAIAAHLLDSGNQEIVLADGRAMIGTDPERSVSIRDLARAAQRNLERTPEGFMPGLEAFAACDGPADGTYSNAVHAAVVEIDMDTGELELRRFVVVEDCGTIINPLIVDGQVAGGVVQGIGSALLEHFVYNEECQPLTTNFADYLLPASADLPDIEIHHIETPTPLTPLGAKGMGEGGAIGPAAAIANAVSDALGVSVSQTPLGMNAVWQLIQNVRSENEA